jgi:hypothetical protein
MRYVRMLTAMLFALIAAAACADSPTAPLSARAENAGPVRDDIIRLDPITVVGQCDPWTDTNWCEEDDGGQCMSSIYPGSAEFVYVSSCPGTGGPGSGPGGGDPGGGNPGGSTGSPDDREVCDPLIHSECEKPLTSADSATLTTAMSGLRPAAEFSDSTAREACEEMKSWFEQALEAGDVFRGAFDSDTTNDAHGPHYGAYVTGSGNIHFDPSYLDAANQGNSDAIREVAITALHEGAHWAGRMHPTSPTFDAQGRDYYTDPPFSYLNPGPNSCVRR